MCSKLQTAPFALAAALLFLSAQHRSASADPSFQGVPFSDTLSGSKRAEIGAAVERFKAGDTDGALKLFKQAASKDPDLPPAYILMAELFAQSKQAGPAREALQRAAAESPDDPEAYICLGDIALGDGRLTEADLLYSRADRAFGALKSSPKREKVLKPRLLAGRAGVAQARQNAASALKYLEAWTAIDPDNALAREKLAQALFEQNRPDETLAQLRIAAKLDHRLLTPEVSLALLCEAAGKREQAMHWITAALRAAPKDLNTLLAAARWALETGQKDEAGELTARALALDSKSLEAHLLQGTLDYLLKDYEAAEKHLLFVLQQSPTQSVALDNLALALCEQDDEAKKRRALEYAQINIREHPERAEAYATLGRVMYHFGHLEEAEKALRAAATKGQISPDAAYCLARIDLATKRNDEAKQLLKAALRGRGLFMQRQEARALAEQIKAAQGPKGE
jgi:tetratricopeptide (TPR) repeat protein